MQIDGEGIANLLVIMVFQKKLIKKTPFHASLHWNEVYIFQFGIFQVMITTMTYNLWNLKLSYLNQPHESLL